MLSGQELSLFANALGKDPEAVQVIPMGREGGDQHAIFIHILWITILW